jgi:putative ABC transport system ATP-binding protein
MDAPLWPRAFILHHVPVVTSTDLPAVELSHASKVYPGLTPVVALHDVSLTIGRGTLVAVMGPSGSGKSTLLNLIGGLDIPSSGTVVVAGTDLSGLTETARSIWRRTEVAFVFQAYHLLPTLTSAQNVALPLHLHGVSRREADRRAARALDDVGLRERAGHVPDELSGGERQRVAIARALVTEPRLLLADEPTGNLDSQSGAHILTLLFDITRTRGGTLVMVTHNRDATARCDRVLTLADGRLDGDRRP